MGGHPKLSRCALACALTTHGAVAWAQGTAQQVEVVGTAPLPGLGVERDALPYSSIVVRRGAIDQAQSGNVTDFLSRRLAGMQVNEIQGSPFQADLSFRGYRASGLLGASQGLSVYIDGVRINEPFGDVVNWDLIPEYSLQSVSVVPGANPAFGLNTLGGAIAFTTANGLSAPGLRAELGFGSFGRKRVDVSHGSSDDGWHRYVGATLFDENGWRDHSPGKLGQLLAKVGRSQGDSGWDITLLAGRSKLTGNGLVPSESLAADGTRTPDLYAARREAVYTHPDRTRNTLGQLAFNSYQQLDAATQLQALAYLRGTQRDTTNGDAADAPGVVASLNATTMRQAGLGAAISLSRKAGAHQWQVGTSIDSSRVRYRQTEQEGGFDASRGVVPDPAAGAEQSAALEGRSLSLGVYATDTWRIADSTHLTATARANRSLVSNQLTTVDDLTGDPLALAEESFHYTSLNPALGMAHRVSPALTVFANAARNTRVPTAIELGCADPAQPCRLPAGLQSDPYLDQVKSTSVETGARWRAGEIQRIELTLYRTDNRNDILFGSVSTTGQLGYFQNFPRTRHQGLDLQWQAALDETTISASASRLRATYEATGVLRMGERNVSVNPGSRIAGLPETTLKFGADWRFAPGWSIGVDLQWAASRVVQGNEDGVIEDGASERVDLKLPAYSVAHLRVSWQPRPSLELIARIGNLFDKRYATYGALAATVFDAQGAYTGVGQEALFIAPGSPRSVFVGLRMKL